LDVVRKHSGDAQLARKQILIVEDDPSTIRRISSSLAGSGYDVVEALTLQDARAALASQDIQAIVFDRLLGDTDAVNEISDWRRQGINAPVLVLSSLNGLTDRIGGLEAGADDYLAKPFHAEELNARVNALVRARDRHSASVADIVSCGSVRIDRRQRTAERNGIRLLLQPREFRLLETLCAAQGSVVPRGLLLEQVWNLSFDPGTKIIETHISRLRDKLDEAGTDEVIETVRGVGYRLRNGD
jgi:two-component system OmpR family response regulator